MRRTIDFGDWQRSPCGEEHRWFSVLLISDADFGIRVLKTAERSEVVHASMPGSRGQFILFCISSSTPYLALNSPLLEGPFYNADRGELRFVDIYAEKVFVLSVSKSPETLREFSTKDNTIGCAPTTALLTAAAAYSRRDVRRQNVGSTEDGMVLRLDPDGKLHRVVENVITPNGMGWNRANTVMFWAESRSGNVYAFDYDANTGDIRNQRVFFHLDGANNFNVPDGLVIDEEDNIWLALWGGSAVLRISLDGKVTGKIELPTRFVTCPVFVGTELFITTAAEVESEKYSESASYAGNIYRLDVGVKGLPKYKVPMPAC
ncbi:hypothetical protein VTN00DRAFT_3293 [Thermoascus crustaceus]|uniref:uncharacterized protein n=1 Tax=Thermoascus crustaceus TaxID=5088 RepID=UPI0037442493